MQFSAPQPDHERYVVVHVKHSEEDEAKRKQLKKCTVELHSNPVREPLAVTVWIEKE